MLGGGEVIAHALVLGTPRIDVSVGEGVSAGTGGVDGAAQPLSKNTTIANTNNGFLGFILVSIAPRSQS
jgi:hypothetical protein